MTNIKSKEAECDEVILFSGKWETAIEDDSIPLSLIVARVGTNVRSPQWFVCEPNNNGGFRVTPFHSTTKPPDNQLEALVELDVERMTIPAPKALLESLRTYASNEIVLVGMFNTFEVYPRAAWELIERE